MLNRPASLKLGDKVALTAPSSPVPPKVLETSIQSIRFLGLEPIIMESCKLRHGYLAGDDHQRASDLNAAFADQSIKGIFCLRGGYGATRILPKLDLEMIRRNPKIFVGYSDITALHLAFTQRCGFITFHGPMPTTGYAQMDTYSLESLKKNLFTDQPLGTVNNPTGETLSAICPGQATGTIIGGNLSLLQGTLGSPYEVDTDGKILFIEEVDERPYRLDKALTALALAGKFSKCAGIVLGTFSNCDPPQENSDSSQGGIFETSLTLHQIFSEVIRPFGKPTMLNFRAGHIYPQSTIPMGALVELNTEKNTLVFKS